MTTKEIEQRMKDLMNFFNARDWNGFRDALAAECVYEEEATHRKVVGPDRIVAALKEWTVAFPDLKGTLREIFVAGSKGVSEIVWSGTHKGNLALPTGTIPPTGRKSELHAMQKWELDAEGKAVVLDHFFDAMTLLANLGMRPQIGPQPPAR